MLPTPVKPTVKLLILLLILLGAALRFAGIFDDFWLDEIWSWRIASSMKSVPDVLLSPSARYDNNHPLNTLLMYALGEQQNWSIWRLPALACGIGSTVLAATFLRRRGAAEMLIGTLLFSFSYPLVFFSSEARGYSLVVFFGMLAFDAMDRFARRPSVATNVMFVLACALGFLSHLTFLHAYLGMFAWSVIRFRRDVRSRSEFVTRLVSCHALPILFFSALWWTFARHIVIGGSPPQPVLEAIIDAVGRLFASGESHVAAIAASAAAFVVTIACLVILGRTGRFDWLVLLIVTVVISPAVVLADQLIATGQRQPIAPRYFIVPYAMLLLAISIASAQWLRRGGSTRPPVVSGLILVFVVANLWQTIQFLRVGRGHYADAVAYMARRTPSPVITVLPDDPLRSGIVLEFYARRVLPPERRLQISTDSVMWVVVANDGHHAPPGQRIEQHVLERDFDYYGLSGYSWYLYRGPMIPPETR